MQECLHLKVWVKFSSNHQRGGLRKYKERNGAILIPLESHVPPILHNDCQTTYIHLTCQDKSHILMIKKPWQNYCFYLLLFVESWNGKSISKQDR